MLTTAQRTTLKADILANGDTLSAYNNGDLTGLAALYNANTTPSFTVWKSSVSITEIGDKMNGTELAGLTTANQTRLQTIALFSEKGVNPSLADRRQFFDDIFSGAGGTTTRANLLVLWKRFATRGEKVFAIGTGSDATPATLVVEGAITVQDLQGL